MGQLEDLQEAIHRAQRTQFAEHLVLADLYEEQGLLDEAQLLRAEAALRARLAAGALSDRGVEVACTLQHAPARPLRPAANLISQQALADWVSMQRASISKWSARQGCPRGPQGFDPVATLRWRTGKLTHGQHLTQAVGILAGHLLAVDRQAAARAALAGAARLIAELGGGEDALATSERWFASASGPPGRAGRAEVGYRDGDALFRANAALCHGRLLRFLERRLDAASITSILLESAWGLACVQADELAPEEDGGFYAPGGERFLIAGWQGFMEALRAEVLPWLIDGEDPIRERVAARARGETAAPHFEPLPAPPPAGRPGFFASEKQLAFIRALQARKGLDERDLEQLMARYTPITPAELDQLPRAVASELIDELIARGDRGATPALPHASSVSLGPVGPRPAGLTGSAKRPFRGQIFAIRPRIGRKRVGGEDKHAYQGYALTLEGEVAGAEGGFVVGIGKAAQAKHGLKRGDVVSGLAVPLLDGGPVDLHKVSKLAAEEVSPNTAGPRPPWLGPPPPLPDYREAGYVPLSPSQTCQTCIWACLQATPDESRPCTPVCYGPESCPHRAGEAQV